jgi:5-carboxymethyl-2-hydroxymuconate isomerase
VQQPAAAIMQEVYDAAEGSGLFAKNDIKVRMQTFAHYKLGEGKKDFLHISGYIMEGRNAAQKHVLSRAIIEKINKLLPDLSILSINISEYEKETYFNKALLDPLNTKNDRHFSRG